MGRRQKKRINLKVKVMEKTDTFLPERRASSLAMLAELKVLTSRVDNHRVVQKETDSKVTAISDILGPMKTQIALMVEYIDTQKDRTSKITNIFITAFFNVICSLGVAFTVFTFFKQ